MAGKITIDAERCKGCGLCVEFCPRSCIVMLKKSNKMGYFPAAADNTNCTGCENCALVCPEAIIQVQRDLNIVSNKQTQNSGRQQMLEGSSRNR